MAIGILRVFLRCEYYDAVIFQISVILITMNDNM